MPAGLWGRARETQLAFVGERRPSPGPTADLLLAAAAEEADVDLAHHGRDYEGIAAVGALRQEWLLPDGTLA